MSSPGQEISCLTICPDDNYPRSLPCNIPLSPPVMAGCNITPNRALFWNKIRVIKYWFDLVLLQDWTKVLLPARSSCLQFLAWVDSNDRSAVIVSVFTCPSPPTVLSEEMSSFSHTGTLCEVCKYVNSPGVFPGVWDVRVLYKNCEMLCLHYNYWLDAPGPADSASNTNIHSGKMFIVHHQLSTTTTSQF